MLITRAYGLRALIIERARLTHTAITIDHAILLKIRGNLMLWRNFISSFLREALLLIIEFSLCSNVAKWEFQLKEKDENGRYFLVVDFLRQGSLFVRDDFPSCTQFLSWKLGSALIIIVSNYDRQYFG